MAILAWAEECRVATTKASRHRHRHDLLPFQALLLQLLPPDFLHALLLRKLDMAVLKASYLPASIILHRVFRRRAPCRLDSVLNLDFQRRDEYPASLLCCFRAFRLGTAAAGELWTKGLR